MASAVARAIGVPRTTIWPQRFAMTAAAASSPYEGASTGRRLGAWGRVDSGPNAAIWTSLPTLRSRSREVVRNNAWVRKAVDAYVSNVVGTGIQPQWSLPDAPELKERIQKLFLRWTDEADAAGCCDFYGLEALAARTQFQAGECLVRLRPRRLEDGLTVPLQLQLIEPDHLDDGRDGIAPNGNLVRLGIEFDRIGRRAAYWLRREHPGESLPMSGAGGFETVRVPADEVLHIYQVERPGQIRGTPKPAVVLVRLFEFDGYEDAEAVRKHFAAMIGGFIIDAAADQVPFGTDKGRDANQAPIMGLEPGTFPILRPGQDVKFSAPADVGSTYGEWTRQQLRAIAAGLGVTYEQLTGDLSNVSYSSIRAGLVEIRRSLEQLIWQLFVFQFCRPVINRWMDYAVASGALEIPDYARNRARYLDVAWRAQRWPWVDPMKDVMAEKEAVRAGFKSRDSVVAELGDDPEAVDREIAEGNRRADTLGLVLDTDPRRTAGSGSAQDTITDEALRDQA